MKAVMSRILERTKIMRETGNLWSVPWWQDDKYYGDGTISREDAQRAFSELKTIYDNSWAQEYSKYFKKVPTNEEHQSVILCF